MTIQKVISWNGIFIGVIISLAIVSLFNLLGLGLGIARLTGPATATVDINIGFIAWILLSSVVPLLCGSWLAGIFSNVTSKVDGMLHGLVIWGLATIISLLFITTTTGMIFNSTASWLNETVAMQHQQFTKTTAVQKTMQAAAEESLANLEKETADQTNQSATTDNRTHIAPQQISEVIKNITILTFLGFVVSALASVVGGMCGVRSNIKNY